MRKGIMARKSKAGGFGPQGEERMLSQDFEKGMIKAAEPSSRRSQKVFRVAAWTFITMFILTNVSNCSQQVKIQSMQTKLDQQVSDTYNPSFKVRYADLGAQVIESWYKGTPPPLNLTKDVMWPSNAVPATVADNSANAAPKSSTGKGELKVTNIAFLNGSQVTGEAQSFYQERLNYYALVNGVPQQISVTLGVPDTAKIDNYPILVAAPSILPYKAPGVSNLDPAPSNAAPAELSEDAQNQIAAWAKSYTENNSTGIKQVTGDSNAKNAYSGLGAGWQFVGKSNTVVWSVTSNTDVDTAIARVTWTMKAPDVQLPVTASNPTPITVTGASQTQTMDVLIKGYKSGSPTVQAWGPVGTYTDLKPFQNAINTEAQADNQLNPEDNEKAPVQTDPQPGATTAPSAPATPAP